MTVRASLCPRRLACPRTKSSKEPLAPLVRHGDNEWADVVRWTLNALIAAEELGITSANLAEMAGGTDNPEINRIMGTEGNMGEMLGLPLPGSLLHLQ